MRWPASRNARHAGVAMTGLQGLVLVTLVAGIPQPVLALEVAELKLEVEELAKKNAALRQRLKAHRELTQRYLEKAEAMHGTAEKLAKTVSQVTTAPPPAHEAAGPDPLHLPTMTISITGDLPFRYTFKSDGEVNSEFTLGRHHILLMGVLSERVVALTEHGFFFQEDLAIFPRNDLERAQLQYTASDRLKVTAGLQNIPLGYWNQTFQHGSWVQTTIDRPDVYRFQRDTVGNGAILPVNSLGVTLSGLWPFEGAEVEYAVGVYNGREKNRSFNPGFQDENDAKGVNTLLSVLPHGRLEGLRVGADVYVDEIPPNADVPGRIRAEPIDELILGAHATYSRQRLELLAELFRIGHDDNTSEETFHTVAGYLQGSYEMGKWTPYYRADLIDLGNGDPYYLELNALVAANTVRKTDPILDHVTHTWGLRWDVLPWNAIKLEYRYVDNHGAEGEHVVAANTSYVF